MRPCLFAASRSNLRTHRMPIAPARCLATEVPKPVKSFILRDFIAESLYARTESYFVNAAPVHSLERPLDFSSMWGFWAYRNRLFDVYKDVDGFMTPVEIFKPYYAQAIGRYIIQALNHKGLNFDASGASLDAVEASREPIHMLEVGAGNGTCAVGILDFLRDNHPQVYDRVFYTIVDVSKAFVERQAATLAHHASKVKIVNQSIFDYTESHNYNGFVIGLEILDNLPHDKLTVDSTGHIRESWVSERPSSKDENKMIYFEQHKPIQDELIIEYLTSYSNHFGLPTEWIGDASLYGNNQALYNPLLLWHHLRHPSDEHVRTAVSSQDSAIESLRTLVKSYLTPEGIKTALSRVGAITGGVTPDRIMHIPTQSYAFLKRMRTQFPNMEFILSDFDYIPGAMPGINAPLVQRSEGNSTVSFKSYLDAPVGYCDIFYPTNFLSLRIMFHELTKGKPSYVYKSKKFLKTYADYSKTRTKTGYNPLLQDFINTKFFLSATGI